MESLLSIMIYVVVALSIMIFSVLAVTTRKILRSATFLLFALFATAAVYFMLGYEFLGGVQIAVYAGGIVVLFVFSILLTSHPGDNSSKLESKKKTLGLIGAIAMFIVCAWSLISRCSLLKTLPDLGDAQLPTMKQIGHDLLSSGSNGYLLPFEAISILLLACIIGGIVVARKR